MKELWDIARALEGCTRHASVHASAVVISDEPLDEHIPLYKDPKRPELITGYAMGPIEKLGLLKMDFLGLRTLTVLANTAALIKESRGIAIDFDTLPLDDAKTYQLLGEARTFGVFQLESPGMRDALRGLRPERLEDIIAIVSLYRPGPMDLIPDFIDRRHGRAKIKYEHPAMETFTRETYGIMVYQEQIMQIASEMGGFTMGEADTLRRAMGKKDRDLMATQKAKFVGGCAERAIAAAKAERVWELMEKFAGYGFNKSHAAAYGLVAYQTAYFKANYPVEFMAALLTSEMGDTDKIVKYIDECRAMEIPVQPPDVNTSAVRFSVAGPAIRFGLAAIKNVGEAAMESILRTRAAEGPFRSLEDFCSARRPAPGQPARDRESHQGRGLRFAPAPPRPPHGPGRCRPGARSATTARAGRGTGLVLRSPPRRAARARHGRGRADSRVGGRSAARLREGRAGLLRLRASAGPLPPSHRRPGRHLVGRAGR